MKLQVKFRKEYNEEKRQNALTLLQKEGATSTYRVFPNEGDDELSTLYFIEFERPEAKRKLLEALKSMDEIEFAEEEVKRKLIL